MTSPSGRQSREISPPSWPVTCRARESGAITFMVWRAGNGGSAAFSGLVREARNEVGLKRQKVGPSKRDAPFPSVIPRGFARMPTTLRGGVAPRWPEGPPQRRA